MGNERDIAWQAGPRVVVRRAVFDDAAALAPRQRQADQLEVDALAGGDAVQVLQEGVVGGHRAFAIEADGQVEALFGVTGTPGEFGTIWLLGSDWIPAHPKMFMRGAKRFLPVLSEAFDFVGNLILKEQDVYRRFLQAFDFQFHREHDGPPKFLLFVHPRFDHV